MPSLYTCRNCGAKFAKLDKLHCETCDQYRCPSCSQCYCNYETKKANKAKIDSEKYLQVEESQPEEFSIFSTVEYAKYLLNKDNLQMKGWLEYVGQRTIHSNKYNKKFLISDFMFYDKTGALPLRIFGPVPLNYFKYRFAMNKVLLDGVTIRLFKGEFELILKQKSGKITLLKEKTSHSLLKFLADESAEKAKT